VNEKPKELKLHQNRENGSVPAIGFQVDANLNHAIDCGSGKGSDLCSH
jgi:hypothetical protein